MMGAEESKTKGASLGSSSLAVDQSLEVKEEDTVTDHVAKKLTEVENEADVQSEKLRSLETSFSKLRVENCNLKHQLSFVSEKVVRLEKHDVHFINVLKDTITLELLEKIRDLEDRIKKLESPDFQRHKQPTDHDKDDQIENFGSGGDIFTKEETCKEADFNEDLQDFLGFDEVDHCNLSEVTIDEVGELIKTDKEDAVKTEANDNVQLAYRTSDCNTDNTEMILVDEAGDIHAAIEEESLIKRLLKRRRSVNKSDQADLTASSKQEELSSEEIRLCEEESVKIQSNDEQLSQLRLEDKLVRLDKEITSSLSSSNFQLSKCSKLLEELLGLELTRVMLLKQPSVVKSVMGLRHYVCLHDQEIQRLVEFVQLINSRSEACYFKFLELFPCYAGEKKEFLIFFQEQVQSFTNKTDMWDEMRAVCLTDQVDLSL